MRASRERAVAHSALLSATDKGRLLDRWTYEGLLLTAIEFTKPRPWWRFW
jgi:hypothetical protein